MASQARRSRSCCVTLACKGRSRSVGSAVRTAAAGLEGVSERIGKAVGRVSLGWVGGGGEDMLLAIDEIDDSSGIGVSILPLASCFALRNECCNVYSWLCLERDSRGWIWGINLCVVLLCEDVVCRGW